MSLLLDTSSEPLKLASYCEGLKYEQHYGSKLSIN